MKSFYITNPLNEFSYAPKCVKVSVHLIISLVGIIYIGIMTGV